jgi:3,4-dihydroxy 2-butanone 4-phosphate synthase/GTP cyclohydrolase II
MINFMARHARGLICLAIAERARPDRCGCRRWWRRTAAGHGTAFTVSVEAREGVTTGISAHDRAHTISVAIDPYQGLRRPRLAGPCLPAGGAATAGCWCAPAIPKRRWTCRGSRGMMPAGVICEILNDDGTMARLPELVDFGREHGLPIGTIADLIELSPPHRAQRRPGA